MTPDLISAFEYQSESYEQTLINSYKILQNYLHGLYMLEVDMDLFPPQHHHRRITRDIVRSITSLLDPLRIELIENNLTPDNSNIETYLKPYEYEPNAAHSSIRYFLTMLQLSKVTHHLKIHFQNCSGNWPLLFDWFLYILKNFKVFINKNATSTVGIILINGSYC